ncbi:5-formyltetrahydrofolate cyclo-ligase [Sporosarcina sp. HYO08]|uniref:5-formyltetrahydrofolate cyclo-ligase n=1 Tax=Sporosarcina sp. HYO08 TaxID=1759557 RepID=UPI00079C3266|nr:5-formyltetrahydrofolate cyclo-ligase [Sporosarcina sp. HYO08]KXH87439.1 5-formyltetrahydrofolate cyclo-ligase [Sporosarcina sp. HYO08]
MQKATKRKQILQQLTGLKLDIHEAKSLAIIEKVLASPDYQNAKTIGITISRFPEVNTTSLIEAAWQDGKQVAVPKCIASTRHMDFRLINSFDQLETVYMDLREPIIEKTTSVAKSMIDVQIVPGVVFSNKGYRIGFGGGYYDRYLNDYTGNTISLAFDCQTGHEVPVEAHDVPVAKIMTETRIIACQESSK